MKKYLLSLGLLLSIFAITAMSPRGNKLQIPHQVQGVEYNPFQNDGKERAAGDWEWVTPDDMVADGSFTMDMIKNWTGEGEKSAALVVQWNYDDEPAAIVFGYHWDGDATGADMVKAIAKNNPRFYALMQYTNMSSPTDPNGGYTINGLGWDTDDDGDIALIDTGNDNKVYTSEDGFFEHPRGYVPGQGGSSDYDYDNWEARDADDMWRSGWYTKGYWSYWVKDTFSAAFSYSSWGASGRLLEDGSWDGWNFAVGFMPGDWKPFVAAPANVPVGAQTDFTIDGLHYTLKNYSKRTVVLAAPAEGVYTSEELNVPSTFVNKDTTYTVVEVDKAALKGASVEKLSLPATVTKIGDSAFENSALTTLNVADINAIKSIGASAFAGCSKFATFILPSSMTTVPANYCKGTAITEIALGENVESIGAGAFENCASLKSITIPATLTTIEASAFSGCTSLTEVTIPATLKSLGELAFAGCDNISSVICESTYPLSITENVFSDAAYANATLKVPSGFASEYGLATGWSKFANKAEFLIAVNEGDVFRANGVTYKVTSVAEDKATVKATYCNVDGTPSFGNIKTANKAGYTGDIVIPAKVTYQDRAFDVTELNDTIFCGASNLLSVDIQAPVAEIGRVAFYDCSNLASVTLPSTVKTINTSAFGYCEKLTAIKLPEGLESFVGERQFFHCESLKSIEIPAGITSLPNQLLSYCKAMTEVKLPDGITKLGTGVFQNCESLTALTLPANITELPSQLLQNCSSLTAFEVPAGVTKLGSQVFSGCSKLVVKLPEGITSMGSECFKSNLAITEFTMPSALTTVPASTFYGCANLTKVTMSDNVKEIAGSAFRGCTNLAQIAIQGKVAAEGETLPAIDLPSKLTKITSYAFYDCKAITDVVLPEGVTTIDTYAFQNSGLTSIYLPETVKTIGNSAFRSTKLTELVVPASATSLSGGDIVGSCSDVKVYACSTNPGTCGTYAWRIVGSTFAPIVVPTGTVNAYTAKNYWKKSTLTAPELQSVVIADVEAEKSADKITVTGNIGGTYNIENLPAQFMKANDKYVFGGKTIKLAYRAAAKDDNTDTEVATLVNEYTEVEVTVNADGTFSATVDAIADVDDYQVKAVFTSGSTELTSNETEVSVARAPFEFAQAEYNAHFDEQFTPELVFNDETYTAADLEFTSSDTKVASVVKRTGVVTVKRVEGDAVITAYVKENPDVKAEMTIHAALRTPVQDFVLGDGSKTIQLTYLDILALAPTVVPEDADIQSYDIAVSDPAIATTHSVRAFNPSRSFYELVTHKVGEADVTFTAQDGSGVSSTYHIVVSDPDRTPLTDNYQDGIFWLNEEWFGHTNGSINYITKDKDVKYRVYESQNPYESFGATSQYGIVFADKLIVMSKQNDDGGDPRTGGGRVVVADAKTLKKLASFDYIGADTDNDGKGNGDGRACVGVGENKVYLGTTTGIQVLDLSTMKLGKVIEGINNGESAYKGQIGDMVATPKYVFAIQQNTGLHVIDAATDELVKTFGVLDDEYMGVGNPQGITVSANGEVWVASTDPYDGHGIIIEFDQTEAEPINVYDLPDGIVINCGWGAWRSTNFFASKNENALWFGAGVEASIVSGNTGYYKWNIGDDLDNIEPVFVFPNNLAGIDEKTYQAPYATVRYDDRTNELLIAATHGSSSNYRYNWLHFVNCATGEISKTIQLKDYYWFPALPIFPDKYAPEFSEISPVEIGTDRIGDEVRFDLSSLVNDRDNANGNIGFALVVPGAEGDAYELSNDVLDARVDYKYLYITPKAEGPTSITVKAISNGRSATLDIPVGISNMTGVNDASIAGGVITVTDRRVNIKNMEGSEFTVYDLSGRAVSAFTALDDNTTVVLTVPQGAYIIHTATGNRSIKVVIE